MPRLPSISIVVPNFNGAATLERTLESLFAQAYPDLQIIVMDGGSTDGSVEIIRRYEARLAYWESEKDRGQSHAINKGFARCTGEIVNWLNSDDYLLPGALLTVGTAFADHPDADIVNGGCILAWPAEGRTIEYPAPSLETTYLMPCYCPIAQPSCFYRRTQLDRTPPLREDNHYAMDFELWNYFIQKGARWHRVEPLLSVFPYSGQNKSSTGGAKIIADHETIYRAYTHERVPLIVWYRYLRLPIVKFRARHRDRYSRFVSRQLDRLIVAVLAPFYGRKRVQAMDWSAWI